MRLETSSASARSAMRSRRPPSAISAARWSSVRTAWPAAPSSVEGTSEGALDSTATVAAW